MSCLAVIPARGGSKGIPKKNLRVVAGLPLVAHSVSSALQASSVDRIVVSTDDPAIAEASLHCGAEVVWRPPALSTDSAPSELALLHVLDELYPPGQVGPEILVFLQCTSPLAVADDIDGTVFALREAGADCAVAVTPFHYFLWEYGVNGEAVAINHAKDSRPMRQERRPQYLETGAVYAMRAEGFRRSGHRFFGKTVLYVMPPERCLEIDDPVDLEVAEILMRAQQREHRVGFLPSPVRALVMDFDGVFTDNRVIIDGDGRETVICDRGDGLGLARLRESGLPMLVLSTEKNPIVQARCTKLGIPCQHGLDDKLAALDDWLVMNHLPRAGVVYVGNDVNDLPCLTAVGCGVVVADAHPAVLGAARLQLSSSGGRGALREITDLILEQTGRGH